MFNFVPNAIQLRGEKFLWMNDLSTFDPIIEWNTNIWLIGDHLSPMNAIVGITALIRHNAGDKVKVLEYVDKIDISAPVSYTHLDVYKRQVIYLPD